MNVLTAGIQIDFSLRCIPACPRVQAGSFLSSLSGK
jgi:hypothetical protein